LSPVVNNGNFKNASDFIVTSNFKIASYLRKKYNLAMNKESTPLKDLELKRSTCPIACSLDIIGDKWTLLVVRDLFFGKSKFKELQESAENIPTNILTSRLKQLEKLQLVSKTPYQDRPVRYQYQLTESGRSLDGIIKAMVQWAEKQFNNTERTGSFSK
jgi:DNA-binding HxlR family transcriptional regulator